MANVAAWWPTSSYTYPPNSGTLAFVVNTGDLSNPTYTINPALPVTKSISGFVFDHNSVAVVGATVLLFKTDGNVLVASTVSGMSGAYVFNRTAVDGRQYYTLAYTTAGGGTQVHGTSDRGLVPS